MKHLLSSTSYLVVNKYLAAKIGLLPVVLLADLISKEKYFISTGQIRDGYFYNTAENIKRDTTLSRYQLESSIKVLKRHRLIDTKLMGVPATTHYRILENNIVSILQTSLIDTDKLDSKKLATNNNKKIDTKINISFRDDVYSHDYPIDMLDDFYVYWTETNKKGIPRYKLQKTWNTKGRLRTWSRNDKKWTKTTTVKKQIDTYASARQKIIDNYEKKNT